MTFDRVLLLAGLGLLGLVCFFPSPLLEALLVLALAAGVPLAALRRWRALVEVEEGKD